MNYEQDVFLAALAHWEELVWNGRMTTIIFIRAEPGDKNEISGYIDLAYWLKTEDFKVYYDQRKKLLPKPSDLSYYNWKTNTCHLNDSPNFRVDANSETGLLFRNKWDRKVINVNPKVDPPGDGTKREELVLPDVVPGEKGRNPYI